MDLLLVNSDSSSYRLIEERRQIESFGEQNEFDDYTSLYFQLYFFVYSEFKNVLGNKDKHSVIK